LGLALDELKENEVTTQINGIDVLISDQVKPYSDGNKIDYVRSANGEGFVIDNPGQSDCGGCSSC
jgi:Fe-S cluster assembly iron-binding protein IscA